MKLTSFCFSFLMFAIQAFGLGDEMHFRHYDNRDGLSHNTVFCAIQDRSGFMWFGTNEGLNRFDGYTFKVYEYDSRDSLSLIQNRVNSMCEASDGTIWICTEESCSADISTARKDLYLCLTTVRLWTAVLTISLP